MKKRRSSGRSRRKLTPEEMRLAEIYTAELIAQHYRDLDDIILSIVASSTKKPTILKFSGNFNPPCEN